MVFVMIDWFLVDVFPCFEMLYLFMNLLKGHMLLFGFRLIAVLQTFNIHAHCNS